MYFTDVHATDWFYDFVRCLYCRGAIGGYSDGTFRPSNNTTRGQMTKIVVLAFNVPASTSGGRHFSDVAPGSTFYTYIETAANHNIVSGYEDGTFRPDNNVTRGQLSKITVIAANITYGWVMLNPEIPSFSDVPKTNAFYNYIETAVCHNIIGGYNDGTFQWWNNATRAQISKIVCLAVQNQSFCGVSPDAPTTK